MRFEVEDGVEEREVKSRDGKTFRFRFQNAYMHGGVGGKEKRHMQLRVNDGAGPRPAGFYVISPESFTTDEYGNLVVRQVVLQPEVPAVRKVG